ncbi:uncharacterized protein LOC132937350 [Metopolophium dirhodum]|uniref:uncharacterized protein LOC132937350 n=1 Tax=Metopolophium dirhodum TaxID=44670 RepID=UPI0029904CC2|nr:uncharacterized protein LOC132937350 [Metopolophium dirhodum]
MFLSYATVPMFAFMILLNFFFMYSPIESAMNGKIYDTCQKCLADTCHKKLNRPCIFRNGGYFCFTCDPENGNQKFYSEAECKSVCKGFSKTCVCADACYVCIAKGIEKTNLGKCNMPTIDELDVVCK